MKQKLLRTLRNVGISIVVLGLLVTGAGFAYTWYMGEQAAKNPQAFAAPSAAPKQSKVEPIKISQTGTLGVSVQMVSSPVTQGSNASIMVRTNPEASCSIVVEYDKVPSKDSGLKTKKADEYGIAEWAWTVEPSVPLGTWPVTVTCANQKNSAVVRGDLKVVKTLEQ